MSGMSAHDSKPNEDVTGSSRQGQSSGKSRAHFQKVSGTITASQTKQVPSHSAGSSRQGHQPVKPGKDQFKKQDDCVKVAKIAAAQAKSVQSDGARSSRHGQHSGKYRKEQSEKQDKSVKEANVAVSRAECVQNRTAGTNSPRPYSQKSNKSPMFSRRPCELQEQAKQKRQRVTSGSEEQQLQKSPSPGSYRTSRKWRKLQQSQGSSGELKKLLSLKVRGVAGEHFQATIPSENQNAGETNLIPAVRELFERYQAEQLKNIESDFTDLDLEKKVTLGSSFSTYLSKPQSSILKSNLVNSCELSLGTEDRHSNRSSTPHLSVVHKTDKIQPFKECDPSVIKNLSQVHRESSECSTELSKNAIKDEEIQTFDFLTLPIHTENISSKPIADKSPLKSAPVSPAFGKNNSQPHRNPLFHGYTSSASVVQNSYTSELPVNASAYHLESKVKVLDPPNSGIGASQKISACSSSNSLQDPNVTIEGIDSQAQLLSPLHCSLSSERKASESQHSTSGFASTLSLPSSTSPHLFYSPMFKFSNQRLWQQAPVAVPRWSFLQYLSATNSCLSPQFSAWTYGASHPLSRCWPPWSSPIPQHWASSANQIPSYQTWHGSDVSMDFLCPELRDTARRWHQVKQVPEGTPGMELSVMSYNILSQDLLEMHGDLYSRCRRQDLLWSHRGPAILQQIISHNPDIICLQEVQADHWKQDIRPALNSQGYYGVYQQRYGDKTDGCAILYKKAKFIQLKFVPVQFRQGGILDRDNVGIVLLLRPNDQVYNGTARKICVATTHLLFNPRRGDIKLAQLMMLLAEIDKAAALDSRKDLKAKRRFYSNTSPGSGKADPRDNDSFEMDVMKKELEPSLRNSHSTKEAHASYASSAMAPQDFIKSPAGYATAEDFSGAEGAQDAAFSQNYCPIILCGDFNSEPFCDLYRLITKGHLRYEGLVNRLICGQSEGRDRGSDLFLQRYLLPGHLGISEGCQYISVLLDRHCNKQKLMKKNNARQKPTRCYIESGQEDANSQPKITRSEQMNSNSSKTSAQHLVCDQGNPSIQHCGFKTVGQSHKNIINDQEDPQLDVHTAGSSKGGSEHEKKKNDSLCQNREREAEASFVYPKTNSGQAYHHMNFKSVYPHIRETSGGPSRKRVLEVSSQHERCSCTVDYIFYSSHKPFHHFKFSNSVDSASGVSLEPSSPGDRSLHSESGCGYQSGPPPPHSSRITSEEGEFQQAEQLELLARYSLLTREETRRTGHLPNATLPSDHLCLIARFFLR